MEFGRFLWKMTARRWFAHKDFTSLEIRKHKSLADHAIVETIKISDVRYIKELMDRIERIPANGDMMISFSGTAEHIELVVYSGDQVQAIDVIFVDLAPVTLSFNIAQFHVRDKNGKTQSIEISAGQLPPLPFDLEAAGSKISILTYYSKEQKRIYPGFFQMVRG